MPLRGQHLISQGLAATSGGLRSGAVQGAIAGKHLTSRCLAATGGGSGLRTG